MGKMDCISTVIRSMLWDFSTITAKSKNGHGTVECWAEQPRKINERDPTHDYSSSRRVPSVVRLLSRLHTYSIVQLDAHFCFKEGLSYNTLLPIYIMLHNVFFARKVKMIVYDIIHRFLPEYSTEEYHKWGKKKIYFFKAAMSWDCWIRDVCMFISK